VNIWRYHIIEAYLGPIEQCNNISGGNKSIERFKGGTMGFARKSSKTKSLTKHLRLVVW